MHGAIDRTVPAAQSVNFQAVLQDRGAHSELLVLDGVDHRFIGPTRVATRVARLRALEVTFDFFGRTLRAPAPRGNQTLSGRQSRDRRLISPFGSMVMSSTWSPSDETLPR